MLFNAGAALNAGNPKTILSGTPCSRATTVW
jgi:hypothetical protein